MRKSHLAALVIDCETQDLGAAAAFWSRALGHPIADEQPDPRYVVLDGPDDQPQILIQRVEHPSRVHFDIESDHREAEVARLEALGARRLE